MENIAEAIKMAFAVFVLAIALTVSFSMFSQAKEAADAVTKLQDKQEYLESADVEGVLYNSRDEIAAGRNAKITTQGYRIVKPDDVISTIYRYDLEKYGVSILNSSGKVITRFDSNTEKYMATWNTLSASDKSKIAAKIKENITNTEAMPTLTTSDLEAIYKVSITGNSNIQCGAPWYGNETEIIKRINAEIKGTDYTYNMQTRNIKARYNSLGSKANLRAILNAYNTSGHKIIEITNEIDTSDYWKDGATETALLKEYQMPTIEVIYILK